MTMTAVVDRVEAAAQSLCSAQGGKSDKQASRVIELFGARTKPGSLNGLYHWVGGLSRQGWEWSSSFWLWVSCIVGKVRGRQAGYPPMLTHRLKSCCIPASLATSQFKQ